MEKEITKQLQKAYLAIKTAYYMNEIKPEPQLRNKLIAIEEILKKLLNYKEIKKNINF